MIIDLNILKQFCLLEETTLRRLLYEKYPWTNFAPEYLYYAPEDADNKVLVVAHMDIIDMSRWVMWSWEKDWSKKNGTRGRKVKRVQEDKPFFCYYKQGKDYHVHSLALDDRLGVYAIMELLPQLNIQADILLTTDEEFGMSTGRDFALRCRKVYNWIVELDRSGSDVVLYQYESVPDLKDDLTSVGFKVGLGTYSDICDMDTMEVGAFNIGIGYHSQHTNQCWASMEELSRQLFLLEMFFEKFQDKMYDYEENVYESPYIWDNEYPTIYIRHNDACPYTPGKDCFGCEWASQDMYDLTCELGVVKPKPLWDYENFGDDDLVRRIEAEM